MLGSGALELGIGLSLFFLFVSLICSAAREAIETVMKSRARDLERGLREMLDDPSGEAITKSLFSHGQIFSLFSGEYDPSKLRKNVTGVLQMPWADRAGLPSYIPARQFATAILDIAARGPGTWPYPVDPSALTVDQLRRQATLLPGARLQRAVLTAIDYGQNDLSKVRTNLEHWFDGGMDRVSGWYKRRTQFWLFVIGFAAAAVLNLDTLTVAQRLNDDENLRKAVISQAEQVQTAGEKAVEAKTPAQVREGLAAVGYPMGWRMETGAYWGFRGPVPGPQTCHISGETTCKYAPMGMLGVLLLVLGWAITAGAISFGAPFWFDVLNKFMVVRSTVKPHQKSKEETSADAQPKSADAPAADPVNDGADARQIVAPIVAQGGAAPPTPAVVAPDPAELGFVPETWKAGFVNKGEIDP